MKSKKKTRIVIYAQKFISNTTCHEIVLIHTRNRADYWLYTSALNDTLTIAHSYLVFTPNYIQLLATSNPQCYRKHDSNGQRFTTYIKYTRPSLIHVRHTRTTYTCRPSTTYVTCIIRNITSLAIIIRNSENDLLTCTEPTAGRRVDSERTRVRLERIGEIIRGVYSCAAFDVIVLEI